MQIIHKIETHLDRKAPAPIVDTVMGETARAVEVSFYEKDQPWPIPEDAHVTIRCGNLDWGTVYDSLPDGTAAFSLRDNTATVVLSPELLQQIGVNYVQLVLTQKSTVLITFMFHVRVEPDPSAGKPGCPEGERNPSKCQQAVADSIAAAQRAEEAARRAEEASKNHQQEFLNIAKYNVDGYGPLAIGAYNGSFEQNIIVPAGFVPIPQDMDLNNAMNIMPGVLNGTYQIQPGNEDTVDFEAGFAFPARVYGGHQAVVVIDPARGKLWHFEFPEAGDYTVSTTTIGGSGGGGGTWEKIGDITTEEEVGAIAISVGEEYKEIYIQASAKSTTGGKLQRIDVASTFKLVQSTSFFPSNNFGTVVVHLKLADGFAFGEFSCVSSGSDGNYTTYNDAGHHTKLIKSKKLSNGFENVVLAVDGDTYQVGASLIVWGCK